MDLRTPAITLLLLSGCPEDIDPVDPDDTALQERTTPLCDGIVGMEAITWELYNGVIATDPVLPPPPPTGPTFSHPDYPLLGFSHPVGWTPFPLRGEGTVGVNLIRDDEQAIWRYVAAPAARPLTSAEVIDLEVGSSRDFFGLVGDGTVVCREAASGEASPGSGILVDSTVVLLRIDGHSLLISAQVVTTSPDLPQSVFVRKSAAPTPDWPDRLYDVVLAIDWQLLYGGGRTENDRDGDGIWDVFDDFPDDPQRS